MKMMIEVDIPEGRSVAEAQGAVKRAFDPDWIASWWHVSDVQDLDDGWEDEDEPADPEALTDEEAREVLRLADKYHDCEEGINWDVLRGWIYHVKAHRKETA
jgi:hypothetical protein